MKIITLDCKHTPFDFQINIGKKILLLWLTLFITLSFSSASAEIILIANPNISETSLSLKDVQRIFLRKKKILSGKALHIAIQKNKSKHSEFLQKYVHKTPSQFNRYYKKLVFTGKGKPPLLVADDSAMLSYISSTPGAIGYISKVSKGEADDTVKIISTH